MSSVYEEVEIEDMTFSLEEEGFFYPCPCGDKFFISLDDLLEGEDLGTCPSCTLKIRIIYEDENLDEFLEKVEAKANLAEQ